jgi:hypothetical protein
MSRWKTLSAMLLVMLFVLLPLYELADIGEQLPHDGDVVLILLFVLFIVAVSIICRGIACVCVALCRRAWRRFMRPPAVAVVSILVRRLDFPLFLIFCDLRV